MKNIIAIVKMSKVSVFKIILALVMSFVSSLLSVLPILFIGYAISSLTSSALPFYGLLEGILVDINIAFKYLFLFFLTKIISLIFRNIFAYYATIVTDEIINSLRKTLYNKILLIDYETYLTKSKGELIHILMNETQKLENIFSSALYTMFSDFFDLLWVSIILLSIDYKLILILLAVIPFIYKASLLTGKVQKNIFSDIQKIEFDLTSKIRQTLNGFETIKAFNAQARESQLFSEQADNTLKNRKKSALLLSLYFPSEAFLRLIGTSALLVYSVNQVQLGLINLGMIAVFFDYGQKFYRPVQNLSRYYQMVQVGLISAEKILALLALANEEEKTKDTRALDRVPHHASTDKIIFTDLSFSLAGKELVKPLSFECSRGDLVLLKGPSGSGKTSLLKILLGFFTVDFNKVFIFGKDINSFTKKELRTRISYFSQEVFLTNASLLNNLIYPQTNPEDYDSEQIKLFLADLALAYELDYLIKEDGENLSGGEKTRLAFLRSCLKDSDIMLLDEVTSALDSKNEEIILEKIKLLKGKKTIFLVSHSNSDSLLAMADRVIEMS